MNFLRRYWAAGTVLLIVLIHGLAIGYVRTRVAKLTRIERDTVEVGQFRFQNLSDPSTVYMFRLYAVAKPGYRHESQILVRKKQVEIQEAAEQMLRQINPQWLKDPSLTQMRELLHELVAQQISEPVITRMVITDWLELPAGSTAAAMLTRTAEPVPGER